MCMQTPDTKLSSVQRSLHCASPTFVSIVFYLSTLPLHSIVHNLAIIASDFCTPTTFPMFIFSSWAYCIFYVWSLCRQASYLYIKQRYNPSIIYISQPCWHMNLLNVENGKKTQGGNSSEFYPPSNQGSEQ